MVDPKTEENSEDPDDSGIEKMKRLWGKEKHDPNNMSFLEHLEEFRWVLVKSIAAFIIGAVSVVIFMDDVLYVLRLPLLQALDKHGEVERKLEKVGFAEYAAVFEEQGVGLTELIDVSKSQDSESLLEWGVKDENHQEQIIALFDPSDRENQYLKALTPFAVITVILQVFFLGGLSVALPFILYFVGQFVLPGLTDKEKKALLPGCIASFFLFLSGACMTYFLILPLSLYFVMMFGNELGIAWESGAGPYYTMVVWMTIAVGTSFEFPLVLVILAWLGVINTKQMKKSRRMVFIILMITAALITPGGDPVSLSLLTLPMYFLYEMAIIFSRRIEKKREKRELAEQ